MSKSNQPIKATRDPRATLIRLIHVARRELQLDEDTYRTLLRTASGGLDSTALMDRRQLQAVLDQAKRSGFAVRSSRAPGRRLDQSAEARKVRALWLFLHHLGAVRDPGEAALAAYCKRIAKVDDLHWAGQGQIATLTETLKKWALRGVLPAAVGQLASQLRACPGAAAAQALASAQDCLLRGQGYDAHWAAWCVLRRGLGLPELPELPALPEPAARQP